MRDDIRREIVLHAIRRCRCVPEYPDWLCLDCWLTTRNGREAYRKFMDASKMVFFITDGCEPLTSAVVCGGPLKSLYDAQKQRKNYGNSAQIYGSPSQTSWMSEWALMPNGGTSKD